MPKRVSRGFSQDQQHVWEPQQGRAVKVRRGILMCRRCTNVFFKKRWLKGFSVLPADIRSEQNIIFGTCPACDMTQKNLFEGEIIVRNIPAKYQPAVCNLAVAFGDRATRKDPQDRIIAIQRRDFTIRITTTENQLAVRLAKKISEAFPTERPAIAYTKEPQEVVRIVLPFMIPKKRLRS